MYIVFIAKSMDGFIAGKNDEIDWLDLIPNPSQSDMGYYDFIENVDAILMGRRSFEVVNGFDVDWPYKIPVYIWSNSLKAIPKKYSGKAELIKGNIDEVMKELKEQGHNRIYIDGGRTIHSFLERDLIDEMTTTTIPVLLGGGIPLFSERTGRLEFELIKSKVYLDQIVQNHYRRKRR